MHSATLSAERATPSAGDFYRTNRGGGLFSEGLSQRAGAVFAAAAYRFGVPPTALTAGNLVVGLATSAAVVALASTTAPTWIAGVVALLGWQLAYALDCADGQLARVAHRTSPAGARVDVLCDIAVQISLVTALSAVAVDQRPSTASWLVALFAGTWMVNLVTSVMQAGPNAGSMVTSTSLPVRLVKLVRDYGAVVFLAGLVLLVVPQWTIWLVVGFTVVNGCFLVASIAFTGRSALRS
ncbi:CDP-alcohol phosphatidyltransferase family protein [Asanoa sp. NPDC049573]|uniref:CDP-alcohol phosphatidyltransferase family protein n=1 Tax=Asanoa sp. NPDC049573 TaxID=3155396 RepID=UPI003413A6C0